MARLRILQVAYSGDNYWFESPQFPVGLSIIEGPNGTGKSTFFNLIYYGLGGRVEEFERNSRHAHKEITNDSNNYVRLHIETNGGQFSLIRKVGDTSIAVQPLGAEEAEEARRAPTVFVLPIHRRSSEQRIFSDWLLDELGIAVVEIYQGGRNFKLNFTDLARLIYHNQSPDPHGIFKPADVLNNLVSDSLEVRRAIFQVLVGKTLLELYQAIARYKRAEKDKDSAKAVLAEYTKIVADLLSSNGINEIRNHAHLLQRIEEVNQQLFRLGNERTARMRDGVDTDAVMASLELLRREFEAVSSEKGEVEERITSLFREKARLDEVKASVVEEIRRIEKILYTHEQLKLFSADTCPYCLNSVERVHGQCVCGSPVDEMRYQRFFYSSAEYIDILKSKAKSLETLQSAAEDVREEIGVLARRRDAAISNVESVRLKLAEATEGAAARPQEEFVRNIEEKMFELRNVISELEQALKLEEKLAAYQGRYDSLLLSAQRARDEVAQLDAASAAELSSRLQQFDIFYTEMMSDVLADCRVAKIDSETYLPVINNGEYREASADVPKRFLYYLTLLRMSLAEEIPFPRLLLVDTPETAGIDLQNLVAMLRQVEKATADSSSYQILLSTGVAKYPTEYSDLVLIRLTKQSKLLHKKQPPKLPEQLIEEDSMS